MSRGYNIVFFGGVVSEPPKAYLNNDMKVFMARVQGRDWYGEPCFQEVYSFGALAENMAASVAEGDTIYITGYMRSSYVPASKTVRNTLCVIRYASMKKTSFVVKSRSPSKAIYDFDIAEYLQPYDYALRGSGEAPDEPEEKEDGQDVLHK